jgi:hypothetical protein
MLQQLVHIIIISLTCIIWGIPLLLVFKTSVDKDNFWYHSSLGLLSFLFLLGCITISLVNSWFALVAPSRFSYLMVGTLAVTGYLLLFQRIKTVQVFKDSFKKKFSLSWVHVVFLAVGFCLFLLLSSLQSVNGDTQIYHLQVIRWQYEYGTVPGIANLYPRLGLNSNWLSLISLFNIPLSGHENFNYLNAALVIWFFMWLFSTWHFHYTQMSLKKSSQVLSLFYFLFILYCFFDWQLFRDAANSTNFDFAVNAFLFVIFSYFIEAIVENKSRTDFSVLLLLFSFSVIGFKFSGIFILLLVAYYLFTLKRFSWWKTAACIALLLVPVFVRNYITSGYPFFPGTFTISSPDWQLPKQMAQRFYQYILLSNKFYNHRLSFAYSFHMTAFNWIPLWFQGILLKHKIILILALFSLIFLFVRAPSPIDHKTLRYLIVVWLLMLAGWFFTAPDPGRFGYTMLLAPGFLFISLSASIFFHSKFYNPVLILAVAALSYYFFQKSNRLHISSYVIVPESIKNPGYSTVRVGEIELHRPNKIGDNSDYRCYFTTLPCITQENPYLVPRGQSILQGFKMKPVPDSIFILNYNY